jgi:hypothetical protein
VANWVSWIDVLYLAFRYVLIRGSLRSISYVDPRSVSFDPIFVLPEPVSLPQEAAVTSAPVTSTPGRRTGTGSAAISSPATRAPSSKIALKGFRRASLWTMLRAAGRVPPFAVGPGPALPLEQIVRGADRPVVVFPECTTSNGRGMLRFADVLPGVSVPVSTVKIFIMCFR